LFAQPTTVDPLSAHHLHVMMLTGTQSFTHKDKLVLLTQNESINAGENCSVMGAILVRCPLLAHLVARATDAAAGTGCYESGEIGKDDDLFLSFAY